MSLTKRVQQLDKERLKRKKENLQTKPFSYRLTDVSQCQIINSNQQVL